MKRGKQRACLVIHIGLLACFPPLPFLLFPPSFFFLTGKTASYFCNYDLKMSLVFMFQGVNYLQYGLVGRGGVAFDV